jgi:hypothetical protein
MFENKMLRKIFGPKGENYIMRSFIIYTLHPNVFTENGMGRICRMHGV